MSITNAAWALLLGVGLASAGEKPAPSAAPASEVLGLYVGMPAANAERRLREIGTHVERPQPYEPGAHLELKQLWKLEDPRFESVLVRFDGESKVKWLTAYARAGGPHQLYTDIGDLAQAHQAGRFIYTWTLAQQDERPASVLTARGTHPDRFSTVSLVAAPVLRAAPAAVAGDSLR